MTGEGEMRLMPEKTVRSRKERLCGLCGDTIDIGVPHSLYRAFDYDRSRDGGETWGAWVEDRRHQHCRPEPLNSPTKSQDER